MSTRFHIAFFGMLAGTVSACETTSAEYIYGMPLSQVEFNLYAEDMGVYPSTSILDDPNNPFAFGGIAGETKWDVLDAGYWPATFYAWGTVLTAEQIGEAQFYTATAAHNIYDRRDCDPADLYYVRQIAIDGYQVVLDEFSDSVTYDALGETAFPLAASAYQGIEALGGTPEGWILVTGADGRLSVVPIGAAAEVE